MLWHVLWRPRSVCGDRSSQPHRAAQKRDRFADAATYNTNGEEVADFVGLVWCSCSLFRPEAVRSGSFRMFVGSHPLDLFFRMPPASGGSVKELLGCIVTIPSW
jgi:hypothetical protein